MTKIRRSYGIICLRRSPTGYQMIMVKKPISYHFCDFVQGRYTWSEEKYVQTLLNNMTYHEKMDIRSFKFSTMWYRIYHVDPETTKVSRDVMFNYMTKKKKFEFLFMHNKDKLLKMIDSSFNSETVWELPKGRKYEPNETDIEAAIREFGEETTVRFGEYRLLTRMPPYIETYTDCGIVYQNKYYFAETGIGNINIRFKELLGISEVENLRWCGLNDLKYMHSGNVSRRLSKMFSIVMKRYKRYKKTDRIR